MKYAVIAARVLLGLLFLFSGLNKILLFHAMPPGPPDGSMVLGLMLAHKWLTVVGVFETIGAVLLLVGRYVPIGLVLLTPVAVNVLLYHLLMDPKGLPVGIACLALLTFLLIVYRRNFMAVFEASPAWEKL